MRSPKDAAFLAAPRQRAMPKPPYLQRTERDKAELQATDAIQPHPEVPSGCKLGGWTSSVLRGRHLTRGISLSVPSRAALASRAVRRSQKGRVLWDRMRRLINSLASCAYPLSSLSPASHGRPHLSKSRMRESRLSGSVEGL